jgi:uncharacterized protein HemY
VSQLILEGVIAAEWIAAVVWIVRRLVQTSRGMREFEQEVERDRRRRDSERSAVGAVHLLPKERSDERFGV